VPQTGSHWERRIERARELAAVHPFSAEILRFYSKVTAFQKDCYSRIESVYSSRRGPLRSLPPELDEVDLGLLLTRWKSFLSTIRDEAPAPLADFARDLSARDPSVGAAILRSAWRGSVGSRSEWIEGNVFEDFCARAFLQPYAEYLAHHIDLPEPPIHRPVCPCCGSPPLVGALRQQGDGAKRSLVCSFCRTEWDFLRIACPACEEHDERKICVFSTPVFACVRVEACETCRRYLKTVDLTKDGLAVPEVDELAAVPLTLWAAENGYSKVAGNIMGV